MIREARKIAEAKLNEALNKNDSKSVREACIVLKALERKADTVEFEYDGFDADDRDKFSFTKSYINTNNTFDGNARGFAKSINEKLNNIVKESKLAGTYSKADIEKFLKDQGINADLIIARDKYNIDITNVLDEFWKDVIVKN